MFGRFFGADPTIGCRPAEKLRRLRGASDRWSDDEPLARNTICTDPDPSDAMLTAVLPPPTRPTPMVMTPMVMSSRVYVVSMSPEDTVDSVSTDGTAGPASPDVLAEQVWLRGDDSALRVAWDQYGKLIYNYCARSLSDRDAASDCTQETFVSAWRSRDRFDPTKGSLASWLMGIARYRVMDAYRANSRIPMPASDVEPVREATTDATAEVADRLLVAHALEQLPARARQVVELAFYSDLSQSEIADRLGLPLGTVKSDMRRALQRLRGHVEGGGSDV